MKHPAPWLLSAGLGFALTACPKPRTPAVPVSTAGGEAALVGTWQDDGGGQVTVIEMDKGALEVSSVVDSDGEVFDVQAWGVDSAGHFNWTYVVPSTDFVVTVTVVEVQGDTAKVAWKNQLSSGEDKMNRQ